MSDGFCDDTAPPFAPGAGPYNHDLARLDVSRWDSMWASFDPMPTPRDDGPTIDRFEQIRRTVARLSAAPPGQRDELIEELSSLVFEPNSNSGPKAHIQGQD